MKRFFWRMLYPFARLGNKLGLLSYAWVNVGIGAWKRDSFNRLWQHQHFGDEVFFIPNYVVLCGIGYRVSVSEGLVSFVEDAYGSRILFERDPHDVHGHLWYIELTGRVPACHALEAYGWVKVVYGGSFNQKRPAVAR